MDSICRRLTCRVKLTVAVYSERLAGRNSKRAPGNSAGIQGFRRGGRFRGPAGTERLQRHHLLVLVRFEGGGKQLVALQRFTGSDAAETAIEVP